MGFRSFVRFRNAAGFLVVPVLIFLAAGRIDYWQGWVFLGLSLAFAVLSGLLLKDQTSLMAERFRPGRGARWWDKGYILLSTPLCFAAVVVASIDAGRRHWSPAPPVPVYVGLIVLFAAGQSLYLWAKRVNPFFSSVARIQADRGQTVCREGPYRFCRHPGYLGGLLYGLATPLVLGSSWALIPQALAAVLLIVRTVLEDRMLTKGLLWYVEYKQAVRARLVPGVW
jgi:protein-S-isoprenylcysteine O-methyltransferase Ste14